MPTERVATWSRFLFNACMLGLLAGVLAAPGSVFGAGGSISAGETTTAALVPMWWLVGTAVVLVIILLAVLGTVALVFRWAKGTRDSTRASAEELEGLRRWIGSMANRVGKAETEHARLEERVTGLTAAAANRELALRAEFATKEDFNRLSAELQELDEKWTAELQTLDEKLTKRDEKWTAELHTLAESLTQRDEGLAERLDQLDEIHDALDRLAGRKPASE